MVHQQKRDSPRGCLSFVLADFLVRKNIVFAGEAKKIGSHFSLGDRQTCFPDVECGNIDAPRQNPRWSFDFRKTPSPKNSSNRASLLRTVLRIGYLPTGKRTENVFTFSVLFSLQALHLWTQMHIVKYFAPQNVK